MRATQARRPAFSMLLVLVWLLTSAQLLFWHWAGTAAGYFDTDDAMRIVQLRDFLGGQGWFDLHQARLAPPEGYHSHWSRLIDAGLAGLFLPLRLTFDQAMAERLMSAIWPLLWILPAIAGAAAVAWRVAGREAALMLLVVALFGGAAYRQFTPGRIDHHNVQIALTMLTLAAMVWSDRRIWCAAAAGALTALTLAIGREALPFLALCGAAMALRYVATETGAAALRAYALSLCAASVAMFLVSVGPDRWLQVHCDAIAINSTSAMIAGAAVLAFAASYSSKNSMARATFVGLAAVAALAVVLATEPRCLLGPYATIDPRNWPLWLEGVRENQPVARVAAVHPLILADLIAFPVIVLPAAILLTCRAKLRRSFAFLTIIAAFLVACVATFVVIRSFSYAIWFAMPLMAVALVLPLRRLPRARRSLALALGILGSPLLLTAAAVAALSAAGIRDQKISPELDGAHCTRPQSHQVLAGLPAGLVAADVNLGPFILALTPHSVLAAPYHRLSESIVLAHLILTSPPDAAEKAARRAGVRYIVLCGANPPPGLSGAARSHSLWAHLRAGAAPDWLDPVTASIGGALTVYRVQD